MCRDTYGGEMIFYGQLTPGIPALRREGLEFNGYDSIALMKYTIPRRLRWSWRQAANTILSRCIARQASPSRLGRATRADLTLIEWSVLCDMPKPQRRDELAWRPQLRATDITKFVSSTMARVIVLALALSSLAQGRLHHRQRLCACDRDV